LKTIADYSLDDRNCTIQAVIPSFYFGSQGIIKEMKVAGYWEYNIDMLVGLQVEDYYKIKLN
jgi:hypothetical protein